MPEYSSHLMSPNNVNFLPFTDEETEAQRHNVTFFFFKVPQLGSSRTGIQILKYQIPNSMLFP